MIFFFKDATICKCMGLFLEPAEEPEKIGVKGSCAQNKEGKYRLGNECVCVYVTNPQINNLFNFVFLGGPERERHTHRHEAGGRATLFSLSPLPPLAAP